jgi:electron transport complex protein RnfC
MLVVQLKPEDELQHLIASKKLLVIECLGCQDVLYPLEQIDSYIKGLNNELTGRIQLDYLCNRDYVQAYCEYYAKCIRNAEVLLVFSCGVGMQVVSALLEDAMVYTGCDTLYLNGFQGLRSQTVDCYQCGECYLNYTGGVCPLTNCPKQLVNGPCGGSQNGKCEVNPDADCAWDIIYRRLKDQGRLNLLEKIVHSRDYSLIIKQSLKRERIER